MSGNQAQIGAGGGNSGGGGGGSAEQQQQHTPPQIIASGATATSSSSADAVNMAADSSPRESGDDSEDESEILEESPCGRWLKRREEVDQRDIPGIDCVHLAMDTEEGVEVVWNELQYSSIQELKSQEEKMRQVFDNLLQLDHQNIVKFHRYWTDIQNPERPRVIFITEFMSSGSLKQFLKRTKRNSKRLPLEAWRRWCTQILSALNYLHSCVPPIIHGNLTCDSIFIQHNGLVKIGTVVPDAVHHSIRQQQQHKAVEHGALHFMAPEYGAVRQLTAAVDIYAFGMCALEMAALEIQNSEPNTTIHEETILRTINSLENDLQRDLIYKCLRRNRSERPKASDLLFHPLLFEVHSLKLLAAHCLIFSSSNRTMFSETVIDGMMQRYNRPEVIMAYVKFSRNPEATEDEQQQEYRLSDVPSADKLEKFVEDVKYGVYPLTAFSGKKPPHFRSRAASPERADSVKSATPEPVDIESRRIVNMMCSVKKLKEGSNDILMTILLRMDDKMNRQLSCEVTETDTASDLTQDLVRLGFVHIEDQEKIQALLEETLRSTFSEGGAAFGEYGAQERTFSATINEQLQQQLGGGGSSTVGTGAGGVASGVATAAAIIPQQQTLQQPATTTTSLTNNPAGVNMTTMQQMERNWSVADSDAVGGAAAAAMMMRAHNPTQINSTMSSPLPPNAAVATATLGLTGTVTVPMVASDPLAGHVMYVPHEQLQQIHATHHQQQHHSHPNTQQQMSPPQQQQMHQQHIDPSMLSMDVTDSGNVSHHHPQQQQQHQQQYMNPVTVSMATNSPAMYAPPPHLTNMSVAHSPQTNATPAASFASPSTTIN
ncbi:nuclear receptor-binding protein homolog [Musca vetustissima]|uniref:nuclear receptor-binding protein homolog n=1 Tax=Musca vetustissima TaxID=27455 RepID=UPI002AB7687B|nr:nuclear receptor-binding protein homolog [Musca vetustissima]